MIDDTYIIENCFNSKGQVNSAKLLSLKKNRPDVIEYLNNRYDDSDDLKEIIIRIKYNIDVLPRCVECGNPVHMHAHNSFRKYCSQECQRKSKHRVEECEKTSLKHWGVKNPFQSKIVKEKIRETNIIKYGCANILCSPEIREKSRKTKLEKYNDENYTNREKFIKTSLERYNGVGMSSDYIKDKANKTVNERYGVDNVFQDEAIKDKIKKTMLHKYGVEYSGQSDEKKSKTKKTMLCKYGVDNIFKSKAFRIKAHKTAKEKGSFNKSKFEEYVYERLISVYSDVDRQHYDEELYPYNCDFYIKDIDTWIEIQGMWTHGKHPYDKDNENDNSLLEFWKSKNNKFYDSAVKVWSISDVEKREIAKRNRLNYLEFFNKKDFDEWFETKLK